MARGQTSKTQAAFKWAVFPLESGVRPVRVGVGG